MNFKFSSFAKWLFCCFSFIGLMLVARIIYADSIRYLFLVWNLFLAFVPYWISLSFINIRPKRKVVQGIVLISWLLFFPNALYIITDIIHLSTTTSVPLWYDAVLLFTSSFLGLVLAFASLKNTEHYLKLYFRNELVNFIIFMLLFAGSYGVYLGRFERWNSWDVFNNISAMSLYVLRSVLHPLEFTRMWFVTFLFTGLYTLCWYLLKTISQSFHSKNATV